MTINELTQKIQASPLSDATKQSILSLVAGHETLSLELESQVQDLIQAEIDHDFAEMGVDNNAPEIITIDTQMAQDLQEVDDELAEDMAFVESELAGLDAMRKDLNQIEDQQKINDLKEEMMQE